MRSILGCAGFVAAIALAASAAAADAPASETGYLMIQGFKTGKFKGEVTKLRWEGALEVLNLDYQLSTPIDPASGLAAGKRREGPISFTVRWSAATTQLFNSAATNELLSKVQFFGEAASVNAGVGTETVAHTLTLTNAHIVGFKLFDRNGDENGLAPAVKITFAFQKIEWEETNGKVAAQDDWSGQ